MPSKKPVVKKSVAKKPKAIKSAKKVKGGALIPERGQLMGSSLLGGKRENPLLGEANPYARYEDAWAKIQHLIDLDNKAMHIIKK